MGNHFGKLLNDWKKVLLATAGLATLVMLVANILAAPWLRAQSIADSAGSPDRPKFDAASVKANKTPGVGVGRINLAQPGGHVTASNVSLKFLIIQAYLLKQAQVRFGETPADANWVDPEHFEIEAEAEGNPTVEQKRLMLQSLLADRFKLVLHHEARQLPEFALVPSKAGKVGPQLKPHTENTKCVEVPAGEPNPPIVQGGPNLPPCGGLRIVGSDLIGQNMTMEQLAGTLGVLVDRAVVDRTGLSGTFDMTLHFQIVPLDPNAGAPDPSAPPSIFTALQEQLGLKLESTKGPVDVIVIDHVEQPSEN